MKARTQLIKVGIVCLCPKFWTSLKLDVISIQVLQTIEDSYRNCIKKKICKYSQFWGEMWKCCEIFLMFKNFFEKDLSNDLMVKLQTVDIYLGHMRHVFFYYHLSCVEIVWNPDCLHSSWQFCMPWYAFVLSLEIFLMNWKI